ncbi:glycerol-3-phosphate ABC transporter ATP-binding protein [Pseudoroseomonas deserti]|uniref:Glycerol-3-phosphate ABC transporter ATP-binding protein n=1 Tax=Teichococcus deserti TaxID=1817963 RepID=A0A1V2GW81_9PROT|nr:ABC transporter ATP-binding protein [Pseudoroseomonas deserti]ONG47056.1 glycerol-3-phosphate ABC transporter ATP-binding protein [Pseudoroseomonas deserti]
MSGIRIEGLVRDYGGSRVLKGVSLQVGPGEFVALVGPSGCGKSTLMRMIAGIDRPDAGQIHINGREVTGLRPAARDVAMVFQSYALYPHLTVAENIAVPLALRRLTTAQRLPLVGGLMPGARAARRQIEADVAQAAESLGLGHLQGRRPGQLSGGQRQRVALARAIVRRPAAFLMDEPLSNLDAALRVQTRREIVDIHRRAGAATLYVTHDQAEALTMADRVAVMQGGEILQVASPEAIYADPADLRVACFIGSPRINTLAAEADSQGFVRVAGMATGLRAPMTGAITLALRPEDLQPVAHGLPAVAEGIEFLGESLLLHARLEDGTGLVLRIAPENRGHLAAGARLALGFDPARALLFGADGKRLPARIQAAEPALV